MKLSILLLVVCLFPSCRSATPKPVPTAHQVALSSLPPGYYKRPHVAGWTSTPHGLGVENPSVYMDEPQEPAWKGKVRAFAEALNQTNAQVQQQQAEQNAQLQRSNDGAFDYISQRSLEQQRANNQAVRNFQQQSYENDVRRSLNKIERNTDPYRTRY